MLAVATLVNTDAVPNMGNKDFLLPDWKESMKKIILPPLCTANYKMISVEGIVQLLVSKHDLRVHAWFAVVENLARNALRGFEFIDCCIKGVFSSEREIVPLQYRPMAIIPTKKTVNT